MIFILGMFFAYLFFHKGSCSVVDFEFDVEDVLWKFMKEDLRYPHIVDKREVLHDDLNSDPDIYRNVTELIKSKGFPFEEHSVETEDGFILGIHRIPPTRNFSTFPNPIVFLQHGLLDSSATWVINQENQSLGFLLAKAGCDVWMGNVRGNTFSRKHKKFSPENSEFWDWSWDEMAKYDIPAMIQYISNTTSSRNINYIGHSQGTLVAFASLSKSVNLQKMVSRLFAMAPVAKLGSIKGFLKYLAKFIKFPKAVFSILGINEFLPSNPLITWIADNLCDKSVIKQFCNEIILMGGLSYNNANMSRIPVYISHNPSGTSVRNMVHFAQLVNSKNFQMYDYFSNNENMKHYNQTSPPRYNLGKIMTPSYIFYGGKDDLSPIEDSKDIIKNMSNLVWAQELSDYEHLDFIWGLNAAELIYERIIKVLFDPKS